MYDVKKIVFVVVDQGHFLSYKRTSVGPIWKALALFYYPNFSQFQY